MTPIFTAYAGFWDSKKLFSVNNSLPTIIFNWYFPGTFIFAAFKYVFAQIDSITIILSRFRLVKYPKLKKVSSPHNLIVGNFNACEEKTMKTVQTRVWYDRIATLMDVTRKVQWLHVRYHVNPLLFDYAVKRLLKCPRTGNRFPARLFEEHARIMLS